METIIAQTQGGVFKSQASKITIGAAADNDWVIDDLGVAPYHAVLIKEDGKWTIQALADTYLNHQKIAQESELAFNVPLQLGIKVLFVLQAEKKIQKNTRLLRFLGNPLIALTLFLCALAIPLWASYLNTSVKYVMNWRLLMTVSFIYWGLTFVMQLIFYPLVKRLAIFEFLSIVTSLSILSDLMQMFGNWLAFQYNFLSADELGLVVVSGSFYLLLRAFVRRFAHLSGRWMRITTFSLLFPCLLLLVYSFASSHQFFAQRMGSYPIYSRALYQHLAPAVEVKSIDTFLQLKR